MKRIASQDLQHILDNTEDLWTGHFRKGSTLFLTGGTGFFGKWILESFIHINDALKLDGKLLVLSRHPEAFLQRFPQFHHAAITFLKGDVQTFHFPAEKIDYIIHAATDATVSLNIEQPFLMFHTIVEGSKRMLELARQKKVQAILHISSGAVYGKQPFELSHMPETYAGAPDVYSPDAAYSEGKRVAEMWCSLYYKNYGVPSKIARPFAFIGPYMPLDGRFAAGNFIGNILEGNPIEMTGDGSSCRSYMYASDLCIWLYTLLFKAPPARPFNVGSEEEITLKELAGLITSCAGEKVTVNTRASPVIPATRYVPSTARALAELGLRQTVSLQEAIVKTVNYYRHESE